jgi:glycerol-3-phosphate dehydrogenase (NAD(P)+)
LSFPPLDKPVSVVFLGDGAWGTALAILLARKGCRATIWGNFPDYVEEVRRTRHNVRFLPDIMIPVEVEVTHDLAGPLASADLLVVCYPVVHLRKVLEQAAPHYSPRLPVLFVSKGIENETLLPGSAVMRQMLNPETCGLMLGPSHAEEVARHQPTTIVCASTNEKFAQWIQGLFMTSTFRIYTSDDVVGAELAAALKNVIAIAAGICDGLGYGDNAKSAIITRGLAEIARLGLALGAKRETFAGLTGLGDLITTCVSPYGRNLKVGRAVGAGKSLTDVLNEMAPVVAEGVWTTKSAVALAARAGVEMPITQEVYRVLFEGKSPRLAGRELMVREPKPEAG